MSVVMAGKEENVCAMVHKYSVRTASSKVTQGMIPGKDLHSHIG
jgi:hypothetical protein